MKWKLPILSLVTALGIGGGHLALRGSSGEEPEPGGGPADRPNRVAANGVVEGARPEVALRPEINGTVVAINYRENQEVAAGALLVELANGPQKQQVALAEADVAVAEAELDRLRNGEHKDKRAAARAVEDSKRALFLQAKKDWERARTLLSRGALSREQYDTAYFHMLQAKADLAKATADRAFAEAPARADEMAAAEGRLRAARARLGVARAELARTRLRAPHAGRVLRVYAEPGEQVGPGSAQPILLFADLSKRRVRTFVEELDALRVRVGQQAVVTCDGLPGREFHGTVRAVLPRMGKRSLQTDGPEEYKDVYVREVVIEVAGGAELPLNLQVRVTIQVLGKGKGMD
jgi:multidrug resistance efflux pump